MAWLGSEINALPLWVRIDGVRDDVRCLADEVCRRFAERYPDGLSGARVWDQFVAECEAHARHREEAACN
jgi:hypothetical protein